VKKFERLDKVLKKIDLLATGDFHKKAVARVGKLIEQLTLEAIRSMKNPRGRAWAPLALTGQPAMTISALASASLQEVVDSITARLTVHFPHAKAHQLGASRGKTDTRSGRRYSGSELGKMSKRLYEHLKPHLERDAWKLPARSVLPRGNRLPPKWRDTIDAEMRQFFGATWDSY